MNEPDEAVVHGIYIGQFRIESSKFFSACHFLSGIFVIDVALDSIPM